MGIHQRLGVLCAALAPGSDTGPDFTALDSDYLTDIWAIDADNG